MGKKIEDKRIEIYMHSSIDKVRNRKKNDALLINGINYGRVIAIQTYDSSFKSIIKELIRLFAFNYKVEVKGNKTSNVGLFYSLRSSKRRDFDQIIHLFRESINDIKYIELIRYISFKELHKKIYVLINNLIKFLLNRVNDPYISAIVVTQYMISKKYLDQFNFLEKLSVFCTFCDAYGTDNLMAQMANNKGITTVTLQHGQYRVLSSGNEIADAEAYENFISNYMLTWGQATVDEFEQAGIDTNRLIKVGALKSFSFAEKISNHKNKGVFGVVLSGEPYRKTNLNMISLANNIAEKYKLKYFLRMHPKNDKSFYMKYCKSEYLSGSSYNIENVQYAQEIDFSLIHMTGVFVELLSINSPIVVYKDILLEKIFQIEPYCIQSIEDFDELYKLFMANRTRILDDQFNKYKYFNQSENVLNNYKVAIEKISKKEFL